MKKVSQNKNTIFYLYSYGIKFVSIDTRNCRFVTVFFLLIYAQNWPNYKPFRLLSIFNMYMRIQVNSYVISDTFCDWWLRICCCFCAVRIFVRISFLKKMAFRDSAKKRSYLLLINAVRAVVMAEKNIYTGESLRCTKKYIKEKKNLNSCW